MENRSASLFVLPLGMAFNRLQDLREVDRWSVSIGVARIFNWGGG